VVLQKALSMPHSVESLTLLLKAKDEEISRLTKLLENLFSQLSEKRNKPAGEIKRPLVVDSKSGKLREKTEQEVSEEVKALQEMGII
jgi:DNA topoisomerase VI subunit B